MNSLTNHQGQRQLQTKKTTKTIRQQQATHLRRKVVQYASIDSPESSQSESDGPVRVQGKRIGSVPNVPKARISCVESDLLDDKSWYCRFQLAPFQPGTGTTVANAIRRALLYDVPGYAITWVDVHGADYPFSVLKGVRESMMDISLNLRQVKLTSALPPRMDLKQGESVDVCLGYAYVTGPAVVRARHLRLPNGIKIVDPDTYICTLSNNAVLSMRFHVSQGVAYQIQRGKRHDAWPSNSDLQKSISMPVYTPFDRTNLPAPLSEYREEHPLLVAGRGQPRQRPPSGFKPVRHNFIPLADRSVFIPVVRCNASVQQEDVGEPEKVLIDIHTNGSVHPRHALQAALKQLAEEFVNLAECSIHTGLV